jgi:hypothetical protein
MWKKFLGWLGEQKRSFASVSLEDVGAFLAGKGKPCRPTLGGRAAIDRQHQW